MDLPLLRNSSINNAVVLLRVDFNCPIENKKIKDISKIKASLPTIKYLLQNNCKIILATHLGRPEGQVVESLCTKIISKHLKELLPKQKITTLTESIGNEVRAKINTQTDEIILLENLRFHKEEEQNDEFFAHSLASLAQVYVNDAFAVSHRAHASIDAITSYLPSYAGFLLEQEVTQLSSALNPKKPAIWILGGGKLDKIDLLKNALDKADFILLAGALPFTFLRAKKQEVGMSKIDAKSLPIAAQILNSQAASKIILPIDFIVASKINPRAKISTRKANELEPTDIALDIGPETIKIFKTYLRKAQTIIWNGPLGYCEIAKFAASTKEIATFLGTLTATSIVGGGETTQALQKFHLTHKVSYYSTSGGAAIEFLSGKELPGISALLRNKKQL